MDNLFEDALRRLDKMPAEELLAIFERAQKDFVDGVRIIRPDELRDLNLDD